MPRSVRQRHPSRYKLYSVPVGGEYSEVDQTFNRPIRVQRLQSYLVSSKNAEQARRQAKSVHKMSHPEDENVQVGRPHRVGSRSD